LINRKENLTKFCVLFVDQLQIGRLECHMQYMHWWDDTSVEGQDNGPKCD